MRAAAVLTALTLLTTAAVPTTTVPAAAAPTTALPTARTAADPTADTLHIPVGSPAVDGSIYQPHVGRVTRLHMEGGRTDTTAVWLNTLELGDSAGRAVHRWLTSGWSGPPGGARNEFNLRSTFDARTLALLGWHMKTGSGFEGSLAVDGRRVRGAVKPPSADGPQQVDFELPDAGFAAGAADLIPYAVGLREGLTMTLPLWSPPGRKLETEVWTVTGIEQIAFDGRTVPSYVMEHFAPGDPKAKGRIWFVDEPPYVVQWDLFPEEGVVVRMIGEPAE